jgi:hypothetical protein
VAQSRRYSPPVARNGKLQMDLDTDRVDEAVLALLHLGLHEDCRAWKSHDWDAMERLHQKGFIADPVGKAKSVVFTPKGLVESERLLRALFERRRPGQGLERTP